MRSELPSLPVYNLERCAHALAMLAQSIPTVPGVSQARALAVGSFPHRGASARDLDMEIFGVSWQALQQFFCELPAQQRAELGIHRIQLTAAGPDGIITKDQGHYGNAFVAVWLDLCGDFGSECDRPKVQLQIPLRVNSNSSRYDLRSREEIPGATLEEAALRRARPFETVTYFDPLEGERGTILTIDGGKLFMAQGDAAKEQYLMDLAHDPVGVYRALRAMARTQDPEPMIAYLGQVALETVCKCSLPTASAQFRPGRFAAERWFTFLESDLPPQKILEFMDRFGVLFRDFTSLWALKIAGQEKWDGLMQITGAAHAHAFAQSAWSSPQRLAHMAEQMTDYISKLVPSGPALSSQFIDSLFPRALPWDFEVPPGTSDPIDPHDRDFWHALPADLRASRS